MVVFNQFYFQHKIFVSMPTIVLAALTMENMEGDYFVVGHELVETSNSLWKEIQARYPLSSVISSRLNLGPKTKNKV